MSKNRCSAESKLFYQSTSAMGKLVIEQKRQKGQRMHRAPLRYKNVRDQEGRSVLAEGYLLSAVRGSHSSAASENKYFFLFT